MRHASAVILILLAAIAFGQQMPDVSQTSPTPDVARQKLPPPTQPGPGRVVVNGHTCTPGDKDSRCSGICGGAWGPCKPDPAKEKERKEEFNAARKRLLARGVPFDPDMLLDWRNLGKVRAQLQTMPEMHEVRRQKSMSGVVLADTLFVPENVVVENLPAVILVNHLVFEGRRPFLGADESGNPFHTKGIYLMPQTMTCLGTSLERSLQKAGYTKDQYNDTKKLPPFSVVQQLDLARCNGFTGGTYPSPAPPKLIGPDQ